ncbi:MAG: Do family serine endopeptidase [Bacteroidales bacterium]
MKRFLSLLFVAVLGGFVAIGIDYYLLDPGSNGDEDVSVTIPHREDQIPAALAARLADPDFSPTLPDFTLVAEMTVDAVVHIRSEFERQRSPQGDNFGPNDFFDFFFGPRGPDFGQPQPSQGAGSGVIVSSEGHIITNNHVVANAGKIEITLNDNRVYDAEVVGNDPTTDLALLKIDVNDLPYLEFGDSDALMVGEWVLAIGNPFNLESTVTAGIVSAKGRNINILREEMAIEAFIQTDAAVNPGNSGGALVNSRGELIGINTAIASNTGSFAGYSFAVPSSIVMKVKEDLMEFGEVQRGLLGVQISELSSRRAEELDIDINQGAYVESVNENSAAEEAGLREGDVIIGINGSTISSPSALIETVARKRPGDELLVRYYRDGRERETTATLKNVYGETESVTRDRREVAEMLGARFETASEEDLSRLNLDHGVQVTSISAGLIRNAGIRSGFIITNIANEPVHRPDDISEILESKSGGVLIEGVYPDGTRAYYGIGLD